MAIDDPWVECEQSVNNAWPMLAVRGGIAVLKKVCIGLAAAVALGAPAQADNAVGALVTPTYAVCLAAAQDEASKGNCLGDELERQNAALKTAFDARAAELGPDYQASMASAQKAWEAYRDADCDAQSIKGGAGSGQAQSWLTCMVRLTAARAAEMKDYGAF